MFNQNAIKIALQALENFKDKPNNNFDLYKFALKAACELNYNSTILCPVLSGSAKDWAHFQVALVNEIIYFTQIAQTPACLISGGFLNNLAENRHFEFAKYFFENLYETNHQISLVSLNSSENSFKVFSKNNFEQITENPHLNENKLDLRFILIN